MKISFNFNIDIDLKNSELKTILKGYAIFSQKILDQFVQQVITVFAEEYMRLKEKPFKCEKCGENIKFIWKTHHGRKTGILTEFKKIILEQLQVQCCNCKHKFYITRWLLGLEPRKIIPIDTIRKLGLIGALTTYRVSEKIISIFGIAINKMMVWRSVQKTGEDIQFDLDPEEEAEGEADGTGIPIQGIQKRGKEIKVFVQKKKGGGVRVAGLSIGNYDSGWNKLFKPLIPALKKFEKFLLVTDGDTNIFKPLKKIVNVLVQRCLWHIPHQMKYYLWKDKVKRKSAKYIYVLSELLEICAIPKQVKDDKIIDRIIQSKEERLENLMSYCDKEGYQNCLTYLTNAKNDMFTAFKNRLNGKTTSHAERVMRTINMRINVGKWSLEGALNVNKVRLAYYYNGFDVD